MYSWVIIRILRNAINGVHCIWMDKSEDLAEPCTDHLFIIIVYSNANVYLVEYQILCIKIEMG